VCVFHCVEHNREHHKRAKPIEVPFRIWVDPKNHVLGERGSGRIPRGIPIFSVGGEVRGERGGFRGGMVNFSGRKVRCGLS